MVQSMTLVRPRRLVVGISGATGFMIGVRVLELAHQAGFETHLVVTPAAQQTRDYECDLTAKEVAERADVVYRPADIAAAISSGSFRTAGMIVAPCSARTLGSIAAGSGEGLLARAADVVLKERRKLVLLVREAPLHLGHLRAMTSVTEMGGIIMPPVPAFYLKPSGVDELITHTAMRALDLFDADLPDMPRWGSD
jgi:4-hydroxy-3-polyprenylbenzoate decarboxylase